MIKLFWGLAFALAPFISKVSHTPALREGKDHFFLLVACLSVFLGIGKLPLFESVAISLFALVAGFSAHNFYMHSAYYQSIHIFAGIVMLHAMLKIKDFDSILNVIATVSLVSVVWVVFSVNEIHPAVYLAKIGSLLNNFIHFDVAEQVTHITGKKAGITPILRFGKDYAAGPLNMTNFDAAYLALSIPAFLRPKWFYCLPILALGLYLYGSLGGALTAVAAIFYYFTVKYTLTKVFPYIAVLILGVAVFLLSYKFDFTFDSGRFTIWKLGLKLTTWKTFLIGNGAGWHFDYFSKFYIINGLRPRHEHNEFLALYYTCGVGGIIAAFTLLYRTVKESTNILALTGLFAVFVNCYGNFMWHSAPLAMLGLFYYAYTLRTRYDTTLER